jgi:hypothetical protein
MSRVRVRAVANSWRLRSAAKEERVRTMPFVQREARRL